MNGFLYWLLVVSLQACVILPWTRGLTALSQRAPAAWLATLLGLGMLLPLAAPWLALPGKTVVVPALAHTGLYDADPQFHIPGNLEEPLPPASDEVVHHLVLEKAWSIAFSLWAAGAVVTLLGRFWYALRERLKLGRGEPWTADDEIPEEWARIATAAGLKRTPWLVRCQAIASPQVIGLMQPALALPPDFHTRQPQERAMILTHEAEHLVRHDPLRRLILEIVRTVFWFHPLFSWLLWHHDLQTEKACDDAVLKAGHAPRDYAELLLAEARRHRHGGKMLRARVRGLLARDRVRSRAASPGLVTGYALLFLLLMLPAFALRISPWEEDTSFRPISPPHEPLAAWWRCRSGHGSTVLDWSGRGLHGRIIGATWAQDPERGSCLEFNGRGDMIALPAVTTDWTKGPLTIAMWLRPREDTDGGGLLLCGEPNRTWSGATEHRFETGNTQYGEREIVLAGDVRLNHEGRHNIGLRPGLNLFSVAARSSPESLVPGHWTHLALTVTTEKEEVVLSWFLNAKPAGTARFPVSFCINKDWHTSWWWFGRGESPPVQGNDFEGRLSELAIFRKALSENELHALMNGTLPCE